MGMGEKALFCFEISFRITNATLALSYSLLINVRMIGDNRPPKYNKTVITKFNDVQDQRQYRSGRVLQQIDQLLRLCFPNTADNTNNSTVTLVH